MRDIIVPVPKNEADHFYEPARPEDGYPCWIVSRRPKDLEIGDYIYFHLNNEIVGRVRIKGMGEHSFECTVTGRPWSGFLMQWEAGDLEIFDEPLPGLGFMRTWRYYDK